MTIYYLCPDWNNIQGGIKQIYRHVDILNRHGYSAFVLHRKWGFRCSWFHNKTKIAYSSQRSNSLFDKINSYSSQRSNSLFDKINSYSSQRSNSLFDKINYHLQRKKRYQEQTFEIKAVHIPDEQSRSLERDDILVVPEIYGPYISNIAKGIKKIIFNQNAHYTFRGFSLDSNATSSPYLDSDVIAVICVSDHNKNYIKLTFPHQNVFKVKNGTKTGKSYSLIMIEYFWN